MKIRKQLQNSQFIFPLVLMLFNWVVKVKAVDRFSLSYVPSTSSSFNKYQGNYIRPVFRRKENSQPYENVISKGSISNSQSFSGHIHKLPLKLKSSQPPRMFYNGENVESNRPGVGESQFRQENQIMKSASSNNHQFMNHRQILEIRTPPPPLFFYKKDDNKSTDEGTSTDTTSTTAKSLYPRIPGIPNDLPFPTINITNVVTLIELAANDTQLNNENEALLVQTLSEVATFIGLQDVRDLIGMTAMYFILGPILIPLFWMPISLIALGCLLIPLVYNGATIVGVKADAGRSTTGSKEMRNDMESYCIEMMSCEIGNMLRGSSWALWISRTFNLTKVEWASNIPSSTSKGIRRRRQDDGKISILHQEDCSKYKCTLVKPMQRFFNDWYSYFFTYRNTSI